MFSCRYFTLFRSLSLSISLSHSSCAGGCYCRAALIPVPFVIDNSLTGAHKMLSLLICLSPSLSYLFCVCRSFTLQFFSLVPPNRLQPIGPLCFGVKIIQNYCLAIQFLWATTSKSTNVVKTIVKDCELLYRITLFLSVCRSQCNGFRVRANLLSIDIVHKMKFTRTLNVHIKLRWHFPAVFFYVNAIKWLCLWVIVLLKFVCSLFNAIKD